MVSEPLQGKVVIYHYYEVQGMASIFSPSITTDQKIMIKVMRCGSKLVRGNSINYDKGSVSSRFEKDEQTGKNILIYTLNFLMFNMWDLTLGTDNSVNFSHENRLIKEGSNLHGICKLYGYDAAKYYGTLSNDEAAAPYQDYYSETKNMIKQDGVKIDAKGHFAGFLPAVSKNIVTIDCIRLKDGYSVTDAD